MQHNFLLFPNVGLLQSTFITSYAFQILKGNTCNFSKMLYMIDGDISSNGI